MDRCNCTVDMFSVVAIVTWRSFRPCGRQEAQTALVWQDGERHGGEKTDRQAERTRKADMALCWNPR